MLKLKTVIFMRKVRSLLYDCCFYAFILICFSASLVGVVYGLEKLFKLQEQVKIDYSKVCSASNGVTIYDGKSYQCLKVDSK